MKIVEKIKKITPKELGYIISVFIVTRLTLGIIGTLSRIILADFHEAPHVKAIKENWNFSKHLWLNIWGIWDTQWYLRVATEWYSIVPDTNPITLGQTTLATFPLYPLLTRILYLITGNAFISGLIISNACLILAAILLFRLVRLEYNEETAYRSVKYMFLYPVAFIFSCALTESLFIMLLIGSFYYARKDKWLLVGILGFLLALTRPNGAVVILPLLYLYLKNISFRFKQIRPNILFLLLLPLGLLLFALYQYYLTGDLLAYVHAMQTPSWGHKLTNPIIVLYVSIFQLKNHIFIVAASIFIVLYLLFVYIRDIGMPYLLLGMLFIFLPLSNGFASMGRMMRYMLVIFPIFIIFAKIGNTNNKDMLLTITLALLQGFLMVFWVNGFIFLD